MREDNLNQFERKLYSEGHLKTVLKAFACRILTAWLSEPYAKNGQIVRIPILKSFWRVAVDLKLTCQTTEKTGHKSKFFLYVTAIQL